MIQKLKTSILSIAALFMFAAPLVVVGTAHAGTDPSIRNSLCKGANLKLDNASTTATDAECQQANASGTGFTNLIAKIINIISVIVGAVAVIMIIWGGFRYVTSAGNDSSVSAAKNTILYAIIGLIIVALAQLIVRFVLGGVSGIG